MAKIVCGIASSHGPTLSTPAEQWKLRANDDRAMPALWYRGERYKFDELVRLRAPEHMERQITLDMWRKRHAACQTALGTLAHVFADAAPDAAIVIGDDQMEIFTDYDMPAFSIYYGDTIENVPFTAEQKADMTQGMLIAERGHHGAETEIYRGEPALARHLIAAMIADEFDVSAAKRLRNSAPFPTSGIPHAYSFVYRQIMKDQAVPNVPVFMNTFFPPNQPSAKRCFHFGKALARAVASWDAGKRVAIIASGGMSHFVIDEEFDRDLFTAMRNNDETMFLSIPDKFMKSGTSEVKNWIAAAGALFGTGLAMELVDYVPCYRSEAGTGTAQAFAYWC
jgi:OH-DDVA oxygenase